MYGVVCGVHQKRERKRGREGERERSLGVTRYFVFLQAFTVFARDARMQEAVVSNFWNKHWLQMNETVVRFNLVNTRRATFRGLQSIHENKANPQTKTWNHGSFVISEGNVLSFFIIARFT